MLKSTFFERFLHFGTAPFEKKFQITSQILHFFANFRALSYATRVQIVPSALHLTLILKEKEERKEKKGKI